MKIVKVEKHLKKFGIALMRYFILIGLAFVVLYPTFVKLSISFMDITDLYDSTVRFIPKTWTLSNYANAIQYLDYFKNLLNTVAYTVSISAVQVFFALLAGYGFACFRFPGRRILFAFVFLTLIVPPQAVILPLYLYFKSFDIFGIFNLIIGSKISLLDTPITLYIMAATGIGLKNGLLIFIFRQYFKDFPRELEESALIDGAGVYRAFLSIALPPSIPIILTGFIFSIVWQWTDVFYTNIFLPDNTLLARQLEKLASLTVQNSTSSMTSSTYFVSLVNNAGIILVVLPIAILYFVLQRYFVESIERVGIVG